MALFSGRVTFSTPCTRGDLDFEAALRNLGKDIDEFRSHYGGYVVEAARVQDDLSITLTFRGARGLPHLPSAPAPAPAPAAPVDDGGA